MKDQSGMINRRWRLAHRPDGPVQRENFVSDRAPLGPPPSPGKLLLRHELLLCAPTIRNWISGKRESYYPTIEIGDPVLAPAASQILSSDDPAWPVGARVVGLGSWQDYEWVDSDRHGLRLIPEGVSSCAAMGLFGMNALTAYFGVVAVGKAKAGETLLVSGAAGSVGAMAAQIGRILGCHVVGLCGSPAKARWLREQCGIESVIDYAHEDVPDLLAALCPDGVDVVFDNVGGEFLHQALARTNRHGRIVLCGQIATYDVADPEAGRPLDMMRIVYGSITLQGFLLTDFSTDIPAAERQTAQWAEQGLIAHREDVRDGFDCLPETFMALFEGSNQGTLLGRIATEEGRAL
ncbi:NADP-dependent oxidoreductase [soil metagenome]